MCAGLQKRDIIRIYIQTRTAEHFNFRCLALIIMALGNKSCNIIMYIIVVPILEHTHAVILKQPPRSGHFSIPDSGQNPRSQRRFAMQNCLIIADTRKPHPYFSISPRTHRPTITRACTCTFDRLIIDSLDLCFVQEHWMLNNLSFV